MSAVVFDLDGTLADTLADLAASMNHALASLGCPVHPVDAVRRMIGSGARVYAARALPADRQELVDEALARFLAHYQVHQLDQTRLYPGVADLLDALVARAVPMAVLSNKPHQSTVGVVDHLLGDWPWCAVVGQRELVPPKPDPAGAREVLGAMGEPADPVLMVGDSEVDMRLAVAAGMVPVGVAWGFRDAGLLRREGAQVVLDEPGQLLGLLE